MSANAIITKTLRINIPSNSSNIEDVITDLSAIRQKYKGSYNIDDFTKENVFFTATSDKLIINILATKI